MADTYVITSVQTPPSTLADPQMNISGTVNGTAVVVVTWQSVYQAHGGTAIGFRNWISPLMLAEYNLLQPPASTTPPTSSWSQ